MYSNHNDCTGKDLGTITGNRGKRCQTSLQCTNLPEGFLTGISQKEVALDIGEIEMQEKQVAAPSLLF